jgi:YbbR domain-containing protein
LVKQIIKQYKIQKLSWPKDWFLKFISVLFAIFLWYFVAGEDRVDMNVQVPVEIVNLPRNLVISNQFKNQLDITVSGPRGLIRKVSQLGVSRSIDLSTAEPGSIVIHNTPDSINFPRGIETLRITPNQVVLQVDRLIKKTIPIVPISTGKLSNDFELVTITLEPNTLIVSGPQQTLKDTTIINTKPIDLSGLSGPAVKQVSLDLEPKVADLIGESIVTAQITIKDKIIQKKLTGVPIAVHGLADNRKAKLSPAKTTIIAELPQVTVRNSKDLALLFEPFIEIDSLPDGTHELQIEIKTSSKITINEIIPRTVNVTLKTQGPEKVVE